MKKQRNSLWYGGGNGGADWEKKKVQTKIQGGGKKKGSPKMDSKQWNESTGHEGMRKSEKGQSWKAEGKDGWIQNQTKKKKKKKNKTKKTDIAWFSPGLTQATL